MIGRILTTVLALLWFCVLSNAQVMLTGAGCAVQCSSVASYTGPGDIVSGASAWYGLRAYNAAYATGSNNAINIRCGSGAQSGNTFNITILTTGALNIAGALTDCGAHATCTSGTASGTTALSLVGCSATPTAGDTFTGTISTGSLVQPVYAASVGTFTGGAGTVTLNAAQTVSLSAVTVQSSMYVTEAYDQTGSGNHATQATTADQPQLFPSCISTLPCMAGTNDSQSLAAAAAVVSAFPFTVSATAIRTGNFTAYNGIIGTNATGLLFSVSPNSVIIYAGATVTATAADSAWHSVGGVFPSGGTGTLDVDGTITTGSIGTTAPSGVLAIGKVSGTTLDGYIAEVGTWSSAVSNTNLGLLCHNQFTYWGTSVSC